MRGAREQKTTQIAKFHDDLSTIDNTLRSLRLKTKSQVKEIVIANAIPTKLYKHCASIRKAALNNL